jgi:TonB family protein
LPANVSPLWILRRVLPLYPDTALRVKLEGKVIVALWIDKEGNAAKAIALLASADCFVQPTMDAVALWKFSPPVKDCEPLAIWANLEFSFLLEDGKPVVLTPE